MQANRYLWEGPRQWGNLGNIVLFGMSVKGATIMSYKLTVVVTRERKFYVAECLELGVASQGESFDEALANLREAVHLYLKGEDPATLNLPTAAPVVTTIEV